MVQPIVGRSSRGNRRAVGVMSNQMAKFTKENGRVDLSMVLGYGVVLKEIPISANGSRVVHRATGCIPGRTVIAMRVNS